MELPWEPHPAWTNIIALIGSVAVVLLWLAPVRDVWASRDSIWATKSTALVATAFGYVAGMFNCILWDMYASTRLDTMTVPFMVNLIGLFLNLSFVVCYWMFAAGKARDDVKKQFIILLAVTLSAAFVWISTGTNDLVGYIAAFVNVLMLFGPLAAAGQVIKSRSTKGMPFPPLVLTLISSIIWFGYGLYIFEVPVMIPNGMGVIFGIAQLSLFAWAKRQEKKVLVNPVGTFEPISFVATNALQSDDLLLTAESSTAPGLGVIHADEPRELV